MLLLGDDGLEGTLAEVTGVTVDSIQGFTYFTQRTVLEYYTKLMGGIDHAADELRCEVVADEYPVGQAKALGNDEQLVLVGKVEQGVVEQYYGTLVFLQQFHESCPVESTEYGAIFDVLRPEGRSVARILKQVLQRETRQFLIVGNDIIPHNVGFTSAKILFFF